MLDVPQEVVRGPQPRADVRVEQVVDDEPVERRARRPQPQVGHASAADQLEVLRDELDLADAAAAELDVDASRRRGTVRRAAAAHAFATRGLRADLPVQLAQRVDRAEVEIAAIDERHDEPLELARRVAAEHRSRHDAALDPREAFPVARARDEVALEHREARHERARVAVGTQSHVDAEHEAVGRHVGERRDQRAAEAREERVVRDRTDRHVGIDRARLAVVGVDEDQVDVGRDVQLAAAELAHADDHQVLRLVAVAAVRDAVDRGEAARVEPERLVDRDLGECRRRLHHGPGVGVAGEVAVERRGEHLRTQRAQPGVEVRVVAPRVAAFARHRGDDRVARDGRSGERRDLVAPVGSRGGDARPPARRDARFGHVERIARDCGRDARTRVDGDGHG